MWEFINYFEIKQLFEANPGEFLFALLLAVVTLATAAVMLVQALASFRLFNIIHEHHHHHYHPEAKARHPLEDAPPGFYHIDAQGKILSVPAPTRPMPPRAVAPTQDSTQSIFDELFDMYDAAGLSRHPVQQAQPATKKRAKMSRGKRMRILRRDGFRCQLCGRKANEAEGLELHVDHKMPVAKGGTDDEENLWTLCHECNGAKSDTIMEELFEDDTEAANTDNKAEENREQ